jgi:Zn-dependent M28 family amino/carboxypeptidase
MLVAYSAKRRPQKRDAGIVESLEAVSQEKLFAYVDMLAFPRHYLAESKANVRARDLLIRVLQGFGCTPVLQGAYDNIVTTFGDVTGSPFLLLGAHYDSVPGTPGADDNGSAVALCLECARLLREQKIGSTMVVFFNREEDGLLGSREFVDHLVRQSTSAIDEAHIFEMVGYCNRTPGSQRMPPGLPGMFAPTVGDFLGLIANRRSNAIAEQLIRLAPTYTPQLSVAALKIYLGMERFLEDLHRSDHAPFWEAGLSSIMWTDTANFRNPHYHGTSDTPDTLDYEFLAQVTKLMLARVHSRAQCKR